MAFDFKGDSFSNASGGSQSFSSGGFDWNNSQGSGQGFPPMETGTDNFSLQPSQSDPFTLHNDPFKVQEQNALSPDNRANRLSTNTSRTGLRNPLSSVSFPKEIPWRIILPVIGIIIAIILCVVFREQITSFLMTVFTWAIIILALLLILRFVFGGRRRR